MKKKAKPYLLHILQECDFITTYSARCKYNDSIKAPVLIRAIVRSLEVIGEAVKNLPQDFKDKHPDIPWKEIAGMRDIINT